MNPTITIGYLPRERFAVAAESIRSLYEHTSLDFELVVMDPATPARYLDEMHEALAPHDNWRVVHVDRPLLPAASKNLLLAEMGEVDYVCFVENDVLFTDGWLDALLAACESFPADVAAPLIREGRGRDGHFDRHLGSLERSTTHEGRWEVVPLRRPRDAAERTEPVQFVEQHCLLFRRAVFDRIGPFDDQLNTRDEVDLSLALHHAGARVVLAPAAVVSYVTPTGPPNHDEMPFFGMRWDLERAAASRDRIRDRWSLVETPGDLEFVRYRNRMVRLPQVRALLEALCRAGHRVLLLDDGDWIGTSVTEGLPVAPFPEAGGHFAGYPVSEEAALSELERAFAAGTTHVVVGWPARWWFEHLPRLGDRLASWATQVTSDDIVDVYSST